MSVSGSYGVSEHDFDLLNGVGENTVTDSLLPIQRLFYASYGGRAAGVLYDLSDLSTIFQDSAGTVPGAVDSVVGLMLDKSGNNNHASQTSVGSKPILRQDASGKKYLEFDGVDDFLVTPSIDFSGTDKMFVCAGVRKLSDAATGVIVELSGSVIANNGAFALYSPYISGVTYGYGLSSKGTVSSTRAIAGFPANHLSVVSGNMEVSTDFVDLRVNGTGPGTGTGDQGTGNFGNYPFYIGRRGGTTAPFSGHLYGLVVAGVRASVSQVRQTEGYMNSRTGAY